jgi:RNA polymerase sigma factor (sigma-70 family)
LEEQLLIQGCLKNDRKAQFQLYKNYFAFVSGICLRYLRSEEEARETTNDIFLKVFTKISLFNPSKGAFSTWIRTLSLNTCLDKMKLGSFRSNMQSLDEETESFSIPSIETLELKDILGLLNKLPPRQLAIFNLFVVEGFSHEEIGNMLGISPGNARWYLSDAKQRLKKIFTGNGHSIR